MRRFLWATTLLTVLVTTEAAVNQPTLPETIAFSDGIAIGRIVKTEGDYVFIEAEEWIRDRTRTRSSPFMAFKYVKIGCFGELEYTGDIPYLFMLRKYYNRGAKEYEAWVIVKAHQLDVGDYCLVDSRLFTQSVESCEQPITESDLLDAVRTFESCFQTRSHTLRLTCSQHDLELWASRSVLHETVVNTALGYIERLKTE